MLNIAAHKNILIKILKDIYKDATLGPLLGFKGGTAALLFYQLSRFSVDLDFDLLDPEKEDYVFERIEKILLSYGKIKDRHKKHFTLFFSLAYSETDHNIKVEISRRASASKYEILNYFGISVKVMVREDMFANKLAALYNRAERTNRDIFDIWYFLQNGWPINKSLVENRFAMPYQEALEKCIIKLEKLPKRSILAGMGELLDDKQKTWAKANLLDETIFLLKVFRETA